MTDIEPGGYRDPVDPKIPRYWDEVWGPSKFDITTMYWVSPLADPDDFVTNNYKCGMAINVQKSCSKEMDAILEEAKSAARHRQVND